MAQSRKEKGIAQLKRMTARWANEDSEFRQYISWRAESLKLLGAGNTSGILAVGIFLTTGSRPAGLVLAAKWCLALFFGGFVSFFLAYRTLYRCAGSIEDALLALRHGSKLESNGVTTSVSNAINESERSGVLVLISTACFLVGIAIAFVGLIRT
jgi:uncharacterized membrane protein